MSLLISGATGFLGGEVLSFLASNRGKIYLLVRPQSIERAKAKFERYAHIQCIPGDLKDFNLGLDPAHLETLQREVTQVLHMGAVYNFSAPAAENYLHNVVGTQNLLHFCESLTKLEYFYLTSTLAVAGDYKGLMYESMFNVGQNFSDPYAETKYRVEGLLGAWKAPVKKIIFRLGVLVGNSRDGITSKVDGPYYLLRSLLNNKQLWSALGTFGTTPFPYNPEGILHLVPVDATARAIAFIVENPVDFAGKWRTYHLTGAGVSLKDFFNNCFRELGYATKLKALPRWMVPAKLYETLGIPRAIEHYMYSECVLVSQTLPKDYPAVRVPRFDEYRKPFFDFVKSPDFAGLKGHS